MSNGLLAPCGLDCSSCPIRLATLEPDEACKRVLREEVARKLKGLYKLDCHPGQVADCDGCTAGGRLFGGCAECPIRTCAAERKLVSCAYCGEYCCEKLERHYKYDPDSKVRMDKLRNKAYHS
jgi:hypothetical protein